METKRKPEISTRYYEISWGRKPRGRGQWGFCLVDPSRPDYLDHVIWKNGSYREAKQAAQLEAAGRCSVLYVCS